VYFTELQGTVLKLMALPLNAPPVAVSQMPGMSLGGMFLNATRTMVGFGWETLKEPVEAWISPVEPFSPRRVSRVHEDLGGIPQPRTEVLRWKSTDGFEIEGLLTYPHDSAPGKKHPLLVIIHGGPMGAFTQSCDAAPGTYPVAVFAARGYAVLRPNIRGSSGYGATFRFANYKDWGGGDFRDVMAGVDQVGQQGSRLESQHRGLQTDLGCLAGHVQTQGAGETAPVEVGDPVVQVHLPSLGPCLNVYPAQMEAGHPQVVDAQVPAKVRLAVDIRLPPG
jgi:hypothetical protein